jgi:hypothetical protein
MMFCAMGRSGAVGAMWPKRKVVVKPVTVCPA